MINRFADESVVSDRNPVLETLEDAILEQFANEDEWLSFRQRVIGASESPILFNQGYSGSSVFKLYHEKLGLIPREKLDAPALRIGKLMEPLLRRLFTEQTGHLCQEVGDFCCHVSKEFPFMAASLDGIVYHQDDGLGVLELKNIHYFNRDEWTDSTGPLKYQIQMQHQMAVTGLKFGYLFGLVGGQEPFAIRMIRNDAFIEKALLPVCSRFYEGLISNTPPEIDGSEATSQALKLLHPDDDGSEVLLEDRFVDLDRRLEELKEQEKVLSTERKLIENEIKAVIGNSTFGLLPNGVKYSLKTTARDGYFVEPTKYRTLRRSKAK